jgi:hypothetical protein
MRTTRPGVMSVSATSSFYTRKTYLMNNPIKLGLAAALAATVMAGSFVPAQAAGDARVRVIHASPDAPAVDVYVNGGKAFSNAPFKGITPYAKLPAGSYLVQVVPAGKTIAEGPVVISATLALEGGKDYSVAATGKLANIAPQVYVDNNSAPAAGKAHVRLVHLSPDAPAVDIIVPAANNLKLFSNIAFKGAGDYTPVDAGTYAVAVNAAGTSTTALNVPGLVLKSGTVYTVWAFGLLAGNPALSAGVSVDMEMHTLPATGGSTADLAMANMGTVLAAVMLALGAGAALRMATLRK